MSKRRADDDPEGVPEPKRICVESPPVSVFSLLDADSKGAGGDIMLRCMHHWLVESNDLHQTRAVLHLRAVSTSWQRAWHTVFHRDVFPAYVRQVAKLVSRIREWMTTGFPHQTTIFTFDYSPVSALQTSSYLLLCVNADQHLPAFIREVRAKSIRQMVAPLRAKESDDPRLSDAWESKLAMLHGDIISLALLQQCSYLALSEGVGELLQQRLVPWYKNKIYREQAKISVFLAK